MVSRTVLYHPLTPFFVLFCNVVATSDPADFHILECVTSELENLVEFSRSIAKLQALFKSFLEVCEGLVSEKRPRIMMADLDTAGQASHVPQALTTTAESSSTSDRYGLRQQTPAPLITPEADYLFTATGTPTSLDSGWGLFDVQPTLDWLDADFSLFDNE